MDFEELCKKVESIDNRLRAVEGPTGPTAPVDAPPPPPAPAYEFDEQGFLVGGTNYGGMRVDPIVGPDCPRTVTPSETGHTLSIARVDLGERFMGYCIRVSAQAHGNPAIVGALAMGTEWLFRPWGGYKEDGSNWPFAADRFYNGEAYGDKGGEVNNGAYGPKPGGVVVPPPIPAPPLPPGEEPL